MNTLIFFILVEKFIVKQKVGTESEKQLTLYLNFYVFYEEYIFLK